MPTVNEEDCKEDHCLQRHKQSIAQCEGEASFGTAFKAKDLALCRGSERCRVLMGAGKEVAAEIAARDLTNPGGAWFLKSGWKAPVSRAIEPSAAPLAPPRKLNLDFKGFSCMQPLASADNRKVAANMLFVAHSCLSDIEQALVIPSRLVADGLEEREEKLARMTVQIDISFAGATAAKPKKAPARAPR